jgi:pyruvate dehydrogenase E2 component (dihydrolipoamide acetyltransferase)
MPIPILMPALSPTMEEGTLAKWHVKVGDAVKAGQLIAEIETDKATMEVEAVDEGRVGEIVVAEGTEGVKVNAPIALLLEEGEDAGAVKAVKVAPRMAAKAATPTHSGGESSTGAFADRPQPSPQGGGGLKTSASLLEGEAAKAKPEREGGDSSANGRIFASPLARRLAAEQGVALSSLKGSGPHGRIVKRDLDGLGRAFPLQTPSAARQARAPEARHDLPFPFPPGSYDEVPLDAMRKTIARRMTASFRDVPHFPLTIDCELDRLLELRKELNAKAESDGIKVSVNDFVIRATALALMKVPDANASYTESARLLHHHADIAVAVSIPGGLITPIIFRAEQKGLAAIAAEMKDKAARARERKLKPEEYQGGTFSLSNLGMMGIKSFASIINEPHGAILSIGAGEQRPVVRQNALAIATVMAVTLTCDHRVVDGAIGANFLAAFKNLIEDPILMLL